MTVPILPSSLRALPAFFSPWFCAGVGEVIAEGEGVGELFAPAGSWVHEHSKDNALTPQKRAAKAGERQICSAQFFITGFLLYKNEGSKFYLPFCNPGA